MALLCGIDVGTTGTKAALYRDNGELVGEGYAEYTVRIPRVGWAEQDPEDWWRATCRAVRATIAEAAPGTAGEIAAVAVSAQAPTMLPLDAHMRPVRPALIWMDRRAEREARDMAERFGQADLFALTGNRPDPFYVAPKILWYHRNELEAARRTRWYAPITGYIGYRFTGTLTMDPVHATLLGLRRWGDGSWITELCDFCSASPEQFPPTVPGHQVVGQVTAAAAAECGMRAGTPVVGGTVDGAAAALEAGALEAGTVAEMTGTSTVLLLPNNERLTSQEFIAMPHAVEGISLLLGAMSATGASLKWFRDELGDAERRAAETEGGDVYELLCETAREAEPGSGGVVFLPYMMGERAPIWDSAARGVFFGLSLSTRRAELLRSVLEGAAFALRHNVEVARRSGITIAEVRTVGGGARSELWSQIKADVLGVPLALPVSSGGAPFGDAVLAGMGAGIIGDPRKFLSEAIGIVRRFRPNEANHEVYLRRYETYRKIYESLRPAFQDALSGAEHVE